MTDNRDSLTYLPIADRVSAGIDFLDGRVPGWDERIDLDTLKIEHCTRCVLGQLFGDFGDGLDQLDLYHDKDVRLGFAREPGESIFVYRDLTAAWTAAIRARREVSHG